MTDLPKTVEELWKMIAPAINRALDKIIRPVDDKIDRIGKDVARIDSYLSDERDAEFERIDKRFERLEARMASLEQTLNEGFERLRQDLKKNGGNAT